MSGLVARLGAPDAEGWRRLHPLSPLLRGGVFFVVAIGVLIANLRDRLVEFFVAGRAVGGSGDGTPNGDVIDFAGYLSERGLLLLAIAVFLVVVVMIIVISWVTWRFATHRVTSEAFEVRRGIVFRRHRGAPLERIQSVNLQRPLIARALGLTKVEVLTAGQGAKLELAYLGYRDAKVLREQILRTASERVRATFSEPNPPASASQPLERGAALVAAASSQLAARAQDFVDEDIDATALEHNTLVRVSTGRLIAATALSWETLAGFFALVAIIIVGRVWHPAVFFTIVPLVFAFVGVTFGRFNRGFQFTLSRSKDALRIGAGLTSTITESMPLGKIHAVVAQQPLLWRGVGWWRVRVTTAGHSIAQGGQNTLQNVVLPVGEEADVLRVIDTLLPGSSGDAAEIEALRDALSGSATGFLGAGPRSWWVLLWGRRRAGIAIHNAASQAATLRIRRGFLTRSLSVMPIVRAQSIELRRPLLHRALGLASLQAHTLLGPVRMEMRGIELGRARLTFDDLAATMIGAQTADAMRGDES